MNHQNENPPPYYPPGKIINPELPRPKVRTIIPLFFFDIDITDFPRIKFICNHKTTKNETPNQSYVI